MQGYLGVHLVSWFLTYLRYLQPTYTRVIIHLQSTMDIPVWLRLILRAIRSIFTFSLGDLGPNYEFPRKHYGRQATREGFCVCCGGNGGFTQVDGAVGVACCVAFHGLRLEVGAWLSKFPSFPTQPQSLNSQFIPLAKWPIQLSQRKGEPCSSPIIFVRCKLAVKLPWFCRKRWIFGVFFSLQIFVPSTS